MKSSPVVLWLRMIALAVAGCGPLQSPMPPRLDAEGQKKIDEGWDRAIRPVDHFDHRALLDLLMVTRAYESGVDKLTFRSEKRVAAGTVVMEVHYDRLAPQDDRFEVQLVDGAGRVLRLERYGREEVERTYRELFVECEQLRQQKERGTATPEGLRQLAGYEARYKAIQEAFPKPEEKGNPERKGK